MSRTREWQIWGWIALVELGAGGCISRQTMLVYGGDQTGRTYYVGGAGNWDDGGRIIPQALARAGYDGQVVVYRWSPCGDPVWDQTLGRPAARVRGRLLGADISRYRQESPDKMINVIAFSAGTGVAVWACESLVDDIEIDNLVLLGSSLSADYDLGPALRHVHGCVYVYHSDRDPVLAGPVRWLGTIDGKFGLPAGLTGLTWNDHRIINIPWSPEYRPLGWWGGHLDSVESARFISQALAPHLAAATLLVQH